MSDEYGIFWGPELYNYSCTKVPLIEHILYERDAICISSESGVGKSILAQQLMFSLTTGVPFLDTFPIYRKCRVLYIQTEGDRAETLERIGNMKKGIPLDDTMWAHMNLEGATLNTEDGLNSVISMARMPHMHYDVIIIDPLYTTVKGSMIGDDVATDWVRNVRKLKGAFNDCSVIVLHHDNKDTYFEGKVVVKSNKNIFGSVFWAAFFNHNFKFKIVDGVHYLESGKQRSGKIIDKIEMKLVEPIPLMYVNEGMDLDMSTVKVTAKLREEPRGYLVKDLQKATQLSRATIYRAVKRLQDNGIVSKYSDSGQTYYKFIQPKEAIDERSGKTTTESRGCDG